MNVWFSGRLAQAVNDADGFMWQVSGSQFLAMYALWFVLWFALVLLMQRRGIKHPAIAIIGLAGYETPALLRMTIFAPPYMHNWFFLVAAMVLGGLVFWWRLRSTAPEK